MRIELLTPEGDLLTSDTYNKFFTLHGIVMIFFFLIPSIPAVLGNFLLPLMIGAKDLAFPKINLLSWYLYMIAAVMGLYIIITGGVDTGWTFYTPFSTQYSNTHVFGVTFAAFIVGFSSILTGLNFLVTIHRMRAPGLTWFRLPLFVWAMYATSIVQLLATPVLAITLVMLMFERVVHVGIFDPALGGDPLLFQHMFWFYSHPAVYIMILPAMGVASEVVAAFTRKKIFGYTLRRLLVAGHRLPRLPGLGAPHVRRRHLRLLGDDLLLPQLLRGRPLGDQSLQLDGDAVSRHRSRCMTPMLYILGFIGLFTIGGVTGLFLAAHRPRRPRHRHLLRRRALPLRHGRRRGHGLHGRPALLVAEDHRPDVSGMVGAPGRAARSSSAST